MCKHADKATAPVVVGTAGCTTGGTLSCIHVCTQETGATSLNLVPQAGTVSNCTAIHYPLCSLPQDMDGWHNESLVLPQFQLDYYLAVLGQAAIVSATDWLQAHIAGSSSLASMQVRCSGRQQGSTQHFTWQEWCSSL